MVIKFYYPIALLLICFFLTSSLVVYPQPPLVLDSLEKELAVVREDTLKVNIYYKIAELCLVSDRTKAISYIQKAIDLAKQINYFNGLADCYLTLGKIEFLNNNYSKALDNFYIAATFNKETENNEREGVIHYNSGFAYANFSSYERAVQCYQKALNIFIDAKLPLRQAVCYNAIADVFKNEKSFDQCLTYLNKALAIAQSVNDFNQMAVINCNLGDVFQEQYKYAPDVSDLDSALFYLNKSYQIITTNTSAITSKNILPTVLCNIGEVKFYQNKMAEAEPFIQKGVQLLEKSSYKRGYAYALGLMGEVYLKKNEFSKAEAYLLRSLDATETESIEEKAIVYNRMYQFEVKRNNYKAAINYQTKYIVAKDSLHSVKKTKIINDLLVKYEAEKNQLRIRELERDNAIGKRVRNFSILISLLGLLSCFLIYRFYKLRKKLYERNEKLMKEENEKINLQKVIEQQKREQLAAELEVHQKIADLKEQQINIELEFKKRELATNVMHLESKNEALTLVKEQAQRFSPGIKASAEFKALMALINNGIDIDNNFDSFKKHFEQVHPDFFKKLQQKAGNGLSQMDLKYSAYLRMNLSTKEIANLLNIEPSSIRTAKYRLKQKFEINREMDLADFINAL